MGTTGPLPQDFGIGGRFIGDQPGAVGHIRDILTKLAPEARISLETESLLAGDVIGAATETAFTGLTITSQMIAVARRSIRFKGFVFVDDDNGADTWTFQVRLGGVAGTSFGSIADYDAVTGGALLVEGEIFVRTIGAGGTADGWVRWTNTVGPAVETDFVIAGAVDTTADNVLVITGDSSSNHADQEVTLRQFEAQVWGPA